MARPRSDEKRRAILEAALRTFAERGVANTPTSAISEAAGVAEGTLFTYFKTKAELINELYLEMRRDFDRQLTDFPAGAEARIRLRYIWDKFLNLGIGQPERLTVLRQIRATGKLMKESEKPGPLILETLNATREAVIEGGFRDAPVEFMVLQLRAHAEATIEFILVHPDREAECRELGFDLIWKGLTG